MTNYETPNDEAGMTNRLLDAAVANIYMRRVGLRRSAYCEVARTTESFVIRISGFPRHWVFRRSSLLQRVVHYV